jgi:hypothetical protein
MADDKSNDSILVNAAKAIGSAAGKVASLTGSQAAATPAKENLYQADYLGSGTFIIHKPKRKSPKLRQSRLKGPRRGSRK